MLLMYKGLVGTRMSRRGSRTTIVRLLQQEDEETRPAWTMDRIGKRRRDTRGPREVVTIELSLTEANMLDTDLLKDTRLDETCNRSPY